MQETFCFERSLIFLLDGYDFAGPAAVSAFWPLCQRETALLFTFDNCSLDTDRRELRRESELVAVEPQVFDVLLHLIHNRDRVVSRDDLLEAVWGGRIVSESTLSSRINAARAAIGDSGDQQRFIRTIARKGFRFVGQVKGDNPSLGDGRVATEAAMRVPRLPDKPSIAVLPFANMSGDPEQEYFSDGITDDIIAELSKWRWFVVIARNSTFTFKGRAIDVKQVSRELGVRYVVEGSVRRSSDRIRVTAQLIDATTAAHVWSERFDRSASDLFAVEDEVTERVVTAIEPALTRAELQRSRIKPTQDLAAWDYYLQGLHAFNRLTRESNIEACRLFEQALKLDPNLAEAYAGLTRAHVSRGIHRLGTDRNTALEQGIILGLKALDLDETNVVALSALALAQVHLGRHAQALHSARRAIEFNPNYSHGHVTLAVCHLFAGHPEDALLAIDAALRLNPLDPQWYARLAVKASALYLLGRYTEAVEVAEHSRGLGFFYTAVRVLAASYVQLGLLDKARASVRELIAEDRGDTTIAEVIAPFVRADDRQHYADALRKAGLPDE